MTSSSAGTEAVGPMQFRVFVSSTFEDMAVEREALRATTVPDLRRYCRERGVEFEAIDLRWGVTQQAARDHRTMPLCLQELRRCQETSPRLNFIALLGDRYGWRPLPSIVPADEFDHLRAQVPAAGLKLLVDWYRCDDNARPSVYVLQPVPRRHDASGAWPGIEARLRDALVSAATRAFSADDERRRKYLWSAVHQEVAAGVLDVDPGRGRVRCYLRDSGVEPESEQQALRDELHNLLGSAGVRRYAGIARSDGLAPQDVDAFCELVRQDLADLVDDALDDGRHTGELDREIIDHRDFARERRRHFTGRTTSRAEIRRYLEMGTGRPLVIVGSGGSGKSALLSKAADEARERFIGAELVVRFIGATPASSDPRRLLEGLWAEIGDKFDEPARPTPTDYWELIDAFHERLALGTTSRPLVIVVDGLDQLEAEPRVDPFAWVPAELPEHARLVLSVVDAPGPAGHGLEAMRTILQEESLLELGPLDEAEARSLLDSWLDSAHRDLTRAQRAELERGIAVCRLPLYLRLAFEACRRWQSYDDVGPLASDIEGLVRELFARLRTPSEHPPALAPHALRALAAARHGLSDGEMLGVLSANQQVMADLAENSPKSPEASALPFVIWSRLRDDLSPYVAERRSGGATLVTFYHQVIAEIAGATYLSGEARRDAHAELAAYFAGGEPGRQPYLFARAGGAEIPNERMLSELAYQQTAARLGEDARRTLSDLEFVRAKCMASMTFDLLADYDRAITAGLDDETESLAAFSSLVRRRGTELARYADLPGFVLQEANNHGRSDPILSASDRFAANPRRRDVRWWRALRRVERDPLIAPLGELVGAVTECSFSPDGARLVSSSLHGALLTWTTKHWLMLERIVPHGPPLVACSWSPDGSRLAYLTRDGTVALIDLASKRTLRCKGGFREEGRRCMHLRTRARLLSCGRFGVLVHDASDGTLIHALDDQTDYVDCDIAAEGPALLAGYGGVHLYDPDRNQVVDELSTSRVRAFFTCAFSPDAAFAVAGGGQEHYLMDVHRSGSSRMWDLSTKREVEEHAHEFPEPITASAFMPDGGSYVLGSADGSLHVVDAPTGRVARSIGAHAAAIRAIRCSKDGSTLVSASYDGQLRAWDVDALLREELPSALPGRALFCDLSDDGLRGHVWSGQTQGLDCKFHRRDYDLGLLRSRQIGAETVDADPSLSHLEMARTHMDVISPKTVALVEHRADATAPHRTAPLTGKQVISHDRLQLADHYFLIGWSARLVEWDFFMLPGLPWQLQSRANLTWALSPRGPKRYALLQSGALVLCSEAGDGFEQVRLDFANGLPRTVPQCAFSQDAGRVFFSWGDRLLVADLERREVAAALVNDGQDLIAFCEAPSAHALVAAGAEGALVMWETASGDVRHFEGHLGAVHDCAFLDDERFVSIGADHTLRLWHIDEAAHQAIFVADTPLTAVAVARRRPRVVAADVQGTVHLLELEERTATDAPDRAGAAAELMSDHLEPRLRAVAASAPKLQAVVELVVRTGPGREEPWHCVIDAGEMRLQPGTVTPIDMILTADVEGWERSLIDGLAFQEMFGSGPVRGAGDLAKLGSFTDAWTAEGGVP